MAVVAPTANIEELRERILNAVQDMYTDVATMPARTFHFPTGRWACEYLGYPKEELDAIPQSAVESFAGVGYPFKADVIRSGHHVLDIGSGSGTDILIASSKVGQTGEVYGLDMTNSMIEKAKENVAKSRSTNVHVFKGNAEFLPWGDESFDIVTSNGVLNLVPDKRTAFGEIFRVLRRGGYIQISDIVLNLEISEKSRMNPQLWAECIVGAVPEDRYIDMIRAAGLRNVRIIERSDYFDRSPNESTKKTAKQYGAISITITAIKE
jgi:arsenite methyltransferase